VTAFFISMNCQVSRAWPESDIMGKKSRLKKERKERGFGEAIRQHPMKEEISAFLKKRRVAMDEASGLLYIVSLMASFLIYRSIKKHTELPVISPDEEKADQNRVERLGKVLDQECRHLHIESQDIMNELVFPMVGNKALMGPILRKVYEMVDSLIPSDSFRQPTEAHIEDSELWGDSLAQYSDRKDAYFQAVKKLFTLVLAISRAALDDELETIDQEKELEEIRKTHGIEPDDFQKLRRRATEFFKIAFAKYLSIVFQPVREEVDQKIG
jgi:hypothetical protein